MIGLILLFVIFGLPQIETTKNYWVDVFSGDDVSEVVSKESYSEEDSKFIKDTLVKAATVEPVVEILPETSPEPVVPNWGYTNGKVVEEVPIKEDDLSLKTEEKVGENPVPLNNLEEELDKKQDSLGENNINWRDSVVDLLKVIGAESDISYRTELAKTLDYTGDVDDTAPMNIYIHTKTLELLSEGRLKIE